MVPEPWEFFILSYTDLQQISQLQHELFALSQPRQASVMLLP